MPPDPRGCAMELMGIPLCPFGPLAKNPLAHIERTVNQYNTLVLAVTQEPYNLNVHKSDFAQVQEYANTVIVHLSPYVTDMSGLNSAAEPQPHAVSVRLLFNL
jgi:hypothetical protein